jgi:hypothetical protein
LLDFDARAERNVALASRECAGKSRAQRRRTWMKPVTLVAILLIVLGVVALAYPAISYQSEEKILDIGPIEATAKTTETIPLPPLLGGAAIAGGIVLLLAGARKQ